MKEKSLQKLVQKWQWKADKVRVLVSICKKELYTGKRGESKTSMLSLSYRENHWNIWQYNRSALFDRRKIPFLKHGRERRNIPPLWHAAFPSILNHLLLNQWQSSHWPPWRLGWTHRGLNPTGSKTNEGHGFLHELVTNRIKPVK